MDWIKPEVKSISDTWLVNKLTSPEALGLSDINKDNLSVTTQTARLLYEFYIEWLNGCEVLADHVGTSSYEVMIDDFAAIRCSYYVESKRPKINVRKLFREVLDTYTSADIAVDLVLAAWKFNAGEYKLMLQRRFAQGIKDISPIVPVYGVETISMPDSRYTLGLAEQGYPSATAREHRIISNVLRRG